MLLTWVRFGFSVLVTGTFMRGVRLTASSCAYRTRLLTGSDVEYKIVTNVQSLHHLQANRSIQIENEVMRFIGRHGIFQAVCQVV